MVNNTELIIPLLVFDGNDTFYHLQILKRKKEHPELGSNSMVIKTYYISSIEYLHKKLDEIILLCNYHSARACINLNRRSYERLAYHTLRKVTDQLLNKDYRSVRKAYESVCGAHSSETNKKWILDIDDPLDTKESATNVLDIAYKLTSVDPTGDKIITVLPTKNGYHIITKPFNIQAAGLTKIDIHKDNPTILYIP